MIDRYYDEELRYLYESGKEFAGAHPEIARYLNIDAVGDRDPYVERLFEGFAFLTARIREKIDDSFPELTEGLIQMMWPQFLQEIPSAAMIQFKPRPGSIHETRILKRSSEVMTGQVGNETVPCKFITTQDVAVNPVYIENVEKTLNSQGNAVITIRLSLFPNSKLENLSLSKIRLYIHGELQNSLSIWEHLSTGIISARISSGDNMVSVECDPETVCTPAGFTPDESLLPGDGRYEGSLLREYFIYPEKFMFVDIHGADSIQSLCPNTSKLVWTLTVKGDCCPALRFSKDNFRLFVTPAVNLYTSDIEPVDLTQEKDEYRLIADSAHPRSCFIHSVTDVIGIDTLSGRRTVYEPLYTFKNISSDHSGTYSVHFRKAADGSRQCFLSAGGTALDGLNMNRQSLSISALCTNGSLPREEVPEGGINRGGRDFPDFVTISNITRPTIPFYPPQRHDYEWIFLSHQSLNYQSLADAETLKAFLRVYDWSDDQGNQRRIEAINDVKTASIHHGYGTGIIRGVRFEVSIDVNGFSSCADIRFFGTVLEAFLNRYVSINSFIELVLTEKPSGRQYVFRSKTGNQWLI